MRGSEKKGPKKGGEHQGSGQAASASVSAKASSSALRIGQALGNDELQRRIQQGNATRDELLSHMNERLGAMREAQLREQHQGEHDMRSHYKEISDHHKADITMPEPMRWRESAKLYEMAAYQMCNGNLGRGMQLLERAQEAERRAFEAVGKQTGARELGPDEDGADSLPDVDPNQACGPREVPVELQHKADEIQANSTEFKDQPVKKRVSDPWWTLEEEEEEEEEGAASGGG